MQIKLQDYTVEVKDSITWGDGKDIQDVILKDVQVDARGQMKGVSSGALREATYKTLEIVVEKITDKDGNEISFSKEWMNGLPIEDGNKLEDHANQYIAKKKE